MRALIVESSNGKRAFRIAAVAIIIATLLVALGESRRPAAASDGTGIVADVEGTYDVRPADGLVDVEWSVTLDNTGPSPYLEPDDPLNHPSSLTVHLHEGSSAFAAFTAGGVALPVTFDSYGFGGWAEIDLGTTLAYGDVYSLTYRYSLPSSEDGGVIVRSGYVQLWASPGLFLPDEFRSSSLTFLLPWELADAVEISGADCSGASGSGSKAVFSCTGDEFGVSAALEIVDASSRIITSEIIEIDGRSTELILRYFEGDETWAENVKRVVLEGVPVLGEIMGIPYGGPPVIRVSEKVGSELYGYAGLANCNASMCAVAVLPSTDDQVLLHELAHMWSEPFGHRWLAEGSAEYASRKAAGQLGVPGYEAYADPSDASSDLGWMFGDGGDSPPFALNRWGFNRGFTDDPLINEYEAYYWSARFFQELELAHGLGAFQAANAAIVFETPDRSVNGESYMDLLEDLGGARADDLFASFVFIDNDQQRLRDRREVRDRWDALESLAADEAPELKTSVLDPIPANIADWKFERASDALDVVEAGLEAYLSVRDDLAALRVRTEELGLAYPIPFAEAEVTWAFVGVADLIEPANDAIDVFVSAQEEVRAPRGLIAELGLLGKDPSSVLQSAADDIAWARFDESIEHSEAATALIDGAHSDGLTYSMMIAAVVVVMAIVGAIVLVISRRTEVKAVETGLWP